MTQQDLFGPPAVVPLSSGPTLSHAPKLAQPRLSAQCAAIVERLRQGPASNRELATISLKYSGRISDCRAAGYAIECYDHDQATGVAWYRLTQEAA